jgi:hypothetical protein
VIPAYLLSPPGASPAAHDDDDPPQSLLATLVGCVALALRSRGQAKELLMHLQQGQPEGAPLPSADDVETEWDRVIIAYLSILCTWAWDDPVAVTEILVEGGALGVVCLWSPFYTVDSILMLVSSLLNRLRKRPM